VWWKAGVYSGQDAALPAIRYPYLVVLGAVANVGLTADYVTVCLLLHEATG